MPASKIPSLALFAVVEHIFWTALGLEAPLWCLPAYILLSALSDAVKAFLPQQSWAALGTEAPSWAAGKERLTMFGRMMHAYELRGSLDLSQSDVYWQSFSCFATISLPLMPTCPCWVDAAGHAFSANVAVHAYACTRRVVGITHRSGLRLT